MASYYAVYISCGWPVVESLTGRMRHAILRGRGGSQRGCNGTHSN